LIFSADAGYCSAANLRTIKRRRIEGYISTGAEQGAHLKYSSICVPDHYRNKRSDVFLSL
jgi:hypothetical protein